MRRSTYPLIFAQGQLRMCEIKHEITPLPREMIWGLYGDPSVGLFVV